MIKTHDYISLDSTNTEALHLWVENIAAGGKGEPFLVVTGEQTGGKGPLGRVWLSPPGGVSFSLAWPMKNLPGHYRGISLVSGLALARGIERACNIKCGIKWPGDVCVGSRKVAGVLCEMHAEQPIPMVIIGVGINGNFPVDLVNKGRVADHTTLQEEMGREADLKNVLFEVTLALEEVLVDFDQEGLAPILPRVEMRLLWLNQEVRCQGPGRQAVTGYLTGLDETGQAILEVEGGEHLPQTAGDLVKVRRG